MHSSNYCVLLACTDLLMPLSRVFLDQSACSMPKSNSQTTLFSTFSLRRSVDEFTTPPGGMFANNGRARAYSHAHAFYPWFSVCVDNRAQWDWPRKPKFQNQDLHTWILMGNWILKLIYFLQFFYLSTPSAAKLWFHFLHFLQGKIGPKINKIEIRPKSGLKVIISWNKSHYGNIWGMFEL